MGQKTRKLFKFAMLSFFLILLVISSYFLYLAILQLEAEPIQFIQNKTTETASSQSSSELLIEQPSFSGQFQFYPDMRFSKKELRYSIDVSCSNQKKERTREAISRLENETSLLKFFETTEEMADISIKCKEIEREEIPGEYYIAGEGGPTLIVNNSLFYIIERGSVLLFYTDSKCDNYNIELHELLHVLGFKHSENEKSIMFNLTSSCDQVLTSDIIEELKKLYSIEELPELVIFNISASRNKLYYLDFTAEVKNQGLSEAENVKLNVYAENGEEEKIEEFDLESINYGEGKYLEVKNLRLPSRNTEKIKFVIVNGEELDNSNNVIELFLPSD